MLKHLVDLEIVSDVFTEATDGNLVKAGIPQKKVHEFFGSRFSESCEKCHKLYNRSTEITKEERKC